MSEKMLKQVRRRPQVSSPAKSDLSELELPMHQQNSTHSVQHPQQISNRLTTHDVLQLQRVIGNRAISHLLGETNTYSAQRSSQLVQRNVVSNFISPNAVDGTIQRK